MIDEYWTFRLYGYHSENLKPQSRKTVVCVCDECAKHRILPNYAYRDVCKLCAIQNTHKGKTTSDETKQKLREMNSGCKSGMYGKMGDAHPRWKGGITPWRKMLRDTTVYKNWRTAVFERDDYTCQMCDERGCYLEAHHIQPVRDHKNDLLVFDINNGITLCKKCHGTTKNREYDFIEQFENKIGG